MEIEIKSFGLVLEFEMYQSILMFLELPSFFSFLEGLTNGLTIPEGCEILEATRATFLEALCSSVDTPGSVIADKITLCLAITKPQYMAPRTAS